MVLNENGNNSRKSDFSQKLCEAFVAASIPLKKLSNPVLREFLSEATNKIIPDESTLRKNYLDTCYQSVSTQNKRRINNYFSSNYRKLKV